MHSDFSLNSTINSNVNIKDQDYSNMIIKGIKYMAVITIKEFYKS